MAIIANFDGTHKLIFLADNVVNQAMVFDAADLLAEIIVWRNSGTAPDQNDRWARPVRATGGDRKSGDRQIGTSVFLMNDWVLVPATAMWESQMSMWRAATPHRLLVTGDIQIDDETSTQGMLFAPTSGVFVEYQSPNAIDIIATNGNSATFLPTQIWNYPDRQLTPGGNSAIAIAVWTFATATIRAVGSAARLLTRLAKVHGLTSSSVTVTETGRITDDGDVEQTISSTGNSKTLSGSP